MVQSNTNRDEALSALGIRFVVKLQKKIVENRKRGSEASVESIIKSIKKKLIKGLEKLELYA
jgi:ABC-type siderophore export system fused ATPase/permease subunit